MKKEILQKHERVKMIERFKNKMDIKESYILLYLDGVGYTSMTDCTNDEMLKLLLTLLDSNEEYEDIFKSALYIYDKRLKK